MSPEDEVKELPIGIENAFIRIIISSYAQSIVFANQGFLSIKILKS